MEGKEFYISMILCIVMFLITVIVYATALPKDAEQNSKLMTVVVCFSLIVSAIAYFIAARYFSSDPAIMLQFILAITFILLASSLVSVATSSVHLTSLRNNIAANGGIAV